MDLRPESNPPIPPHLDHEMLMKRVDLMAVNAIFESSGTGEEGASWAVTMERLKRLALKALAGTLKNTRPVRKG